MNRELLKGQMRVAACNVNETFRNMGFRETHDIMELALTAIEEAGCVVVPARPNTRMILHAGMAIGEMTAPALAPTLALFALQWNAMLKAAPFHKAPEVSPDD